MAEVQLSQKEQKRVFLGVLLYVVTIYTPTDPRPQLPDPPPIGLVIQHSSANEIKLTGHEAAEDQQSYTSRAGTGWYI